MRVDMKLFKYLVNDADDGTVGIVRITSTLQDAGISAFQAKGKDVEADIRTVSYTHLVTGEEMYFTSELPDDMTRLIEKWRGYISNRERCV